MSPASRPRVSGCRASWRRPCRCRQAPVHTGPLQLRRESTRSRRPRTRSLAERPFCISGRGSRDSASAAGAHYSTTAAACGRSSTGRAPVSKTGGWGFDSLRPCESWKVPRAPDPRPGREASEQCGTGLTVTWPWGHLSRLRPQRWGVRANSIVDSIRQEPDPHCGSGFLSPKRPTAETSGMPALRHMRRLGNWLARLAVDQVPSRACRFESCPAYQCGRRRDQPMAGDGSRLENGRPTRACEFDPRSLRRGKATPGWPGARLLPGSWPRP
jgi:hypothetical protein